MKKQFLARITILCLLLSMLGGLVLPVNAATVTYARNMTTSSAAGTYYVATAADLAQMATLVNASMTMNGYTFLQTQNINLSGVSYNPIGRREEPSVTTTSFQGTYGGQRYTVSNLTYSDSTRDGAGLFGSASQATLKNIGIESGSVTAGTLAYSGKLESSVHAMDVIARDTERTMGDFSSCYYLAGAYTDAEDKDLSETYNNHNQSDWKRLIMN